MAALQTLAKDCEMCSNDPNYWTYFKGRISLYLFIYVYHNILVTDIRLRPLTLASYTNTIFFISRNKKFTILYNRPTLRKVTISMTTRNITWKNRIWSLIMYTLLWFMGSETIIQNSKKFHKILHYLPFL